MFELLLQKVQKATAWFSYQLIHCEDYYRIHTLLTGFIKELEAMRDEAQEAINELEELIK